MVPNLGQRVPTVEEPGRGLAGTLAKCLGDPGGWPFCRPESDYISGQVVTCGGGFGG